MKIVITLTIGLLGIAHLIRSHYQQRKAKKSEQLNGYEASRMYDDEENYWI